MSFVNQFNVIDLFAVIGFVLAVYSYFMYKRDKKVAQLEESREKLNSKLEKMRNEVLAHIILEQQYMNYIAEKEGLNPSGIQRTIRKEAQKADNNPDQLRPTLSLNEAKNY